MEIIESTEKLNKEDKLKVLFFQTTILNLLINNLNQKGEKIKKFNNKKLMLKNALDILLVICIVLATLSKDVYTSFILLFLSLFFTTCIVFFKKIENFLAKDNKEEILMIHLEKDRYLKLSVEDEFLLNGRIVDHIKNFSIKELIAFSKEDLFKTGEFDELTSIMKRLNITTEEINKLKSSKEFIEYQIQKLEDNEEYNFVNNFCKLEKDVLKKYLRDNFKSDFVLKNKEKIKEEIEKDLDYFGYEKIVLNKLN